MAPSVWASGDQPTNREEAPFQLSTKLCVGEERRTEQICDVIAFAFRTFCGESESEFSHSENAWKLTGFPAACADGISLKDFSISIEIKLNFKLARGDIGKMLAGWRNFRQSGRVHVVARLANTCF